MHLSDFSVPADSLWAGKTLQELDLGQKYNVHVASIIRGIHRINIPGGRIRIFPGDTLQVIGTDEQLSVFAHYVGQVSDALGFEDAEQHEMVLKQFKIPEVSPIAGHTIKESGIRNEYRCMVVGIESENDKQLCSPNVNRRLEVGDIIWIVGEKSDLQRLVMAEVK